MRNILIIILVVLFACERNLEVKPKMQISSDVAFSSKENIYAALMGCYDALQFVHYYGRNLVIVGDLASDNSVARGTKLEYYSVDDNLLLTDNILVEGIWRDIYTAVNRVNYMLYRLEKTDILTDTELADYRGQLYFLRALHYYNLVRLYGEIPLKLNPTLEDNASNFLPRTPLPAVYEQIIHDLDSAIVLISNIETHFANATAAKALQASVYLTTEQWNESIILCNEVLEMNGLLESNYSDLYSNTLEPSEEILFYIPFNAEDKNRMAEYHFPKQLGGRNENAPGEALLDVIDERDLRKYMVASTYGDQYYTRKYADLVTGADKVIVLRNAEILFIRAEAYYRLDSVNNVDNILNDINAIRHRAGLDSLAVPLNRSLIEIIEEEKQIELAFEGKRWFDLIRTNRAIQKVPTVTESYQMLFPVPLSEILSNPYINSEDQNEGY